MNAILHISSRKFVQVRYQKGRSEKETMCQPLLDDNCSCCEESGSELSKWDGTVPRQLQTWLQRKKPSVEVCKDM